MSSFRQIKHKKIRDGSEIPKPRLLRDKQVQDDKGRSWVQNVEGKGWIWYQKRWMLMALVFVLIVTVGGFLRLYQIDSLVSILNRDEAALAYNALMLEELGVDEWGKPLSLTLRSFGDYKLIGYPALLVMFYQLLPADDFTVRLPSALAGIGIIILSYPFARVFRLSKTYSLIFSLVIALSPFAIFYSRFAYEANVALFYVLMAILILLGTKTSQRIRWSSDLFAIFLLTLACVTYNSPLILFLPIVLVVSIFRLKNGWRNWLPLLIMGVIAWLSVVWAIYPAISQKSGISIMTDALVALQYISYRQELPSWLQPMIGSKYAYWIWLSLRNLFKSFAPDFLTYWIFHPWHGVPKWGQVVVPVAIMGWLGIIGLIFKVTLGMTQVLTSRSGQAFRNFSMHLLLLVLMLASLLPAIITVDAPHATRSLFFLYLFCLTSVWAMEKLVSIISQKWTLKHPQYQTHYGAAIILALLIIVSSVFYIKDLFGRYRIESIRIYKAGIPMTIERLPATGNVAIIDKDGLDYIRWAWYSKLSPDQFLESIIRRPPTVSGLSFIDQVGRFYFIDWVNNRQANQIYLVQWSEEKTSWEVLP